MSEKYKMFKQFMHNELGIQRRTSPRVALAKVATRAAVRLAGSWRDDLRDVRCKM